MANEVTSYYEPGRDLSAVATGTVVGKRFVKISGNRSTAGATEGAISVAQCGAGERACGVASWDAATGQMLGVVRGNSRVVPVTAAADITAGAEVESTANGRATTKSSGVALGYVVTGATNGGDAQVSLY